MEQVVAAPTEEGERLEAPASCHDEAWEKVRVVSAMEFYNLLISLRYAVVDLRARAEWEEGPRMDMAQPYWPHHHHHHLAEGGSWQDAWGFESQERVLLYATTPAAATTVASAADHGGECTGAEGCGGLRGRVGEFVEGLLVDPHHREVREVLLLDGGLEAFAARYAFLTADGLALHPSDGCHFYPSHIWQTRGAGEGRGLFLGSKFPSRDRKALDDLHIRHILNVTWEVTNEFEDSDDFTYHRCVVADKESEDIARYFEECWAFIDDAFRQGSSVLVHCAQGVSRSATIVVSYLVGACGWRLPAAYAHVQRHREVVDINRGFYRQLLQLDARLHDT